MKPVILGWHWRIAARVDAPRGAQHRERVASALAQMPARLALHTVSEPGVFAHADGSVAGVIILAESHLSLHLFPERGLVRGDLFSCKEGDVSADLRCLGRHFEVTALQHDMVLRSAPAERPPGPRLAAELERSLATLDRGSATWAYLSLTIDASGDAALAEPPAVDGLAAQLLDRLELQLPRRMVHLFSPIGVTLVHFGELGRLVIHTWPEHQLATVDLSCPRAAMERCVPRLTDGTLLELIDARLLPLDQPALAPEST